MSKRIFLVLILYLFISNNVNAQTISIKGIVLDSANQYPLISATVVLNDKNNETKYHDLTNKKGEFEIKDVKGGSYKLKISYVGYLDFEKGLSVKDKDINLGNLLISQSEISTDVVNVTANAPIGVQKDDTTIFNANSVKTSPDATTEDLVKKLPGVQVESDGTVKAQGEQVKKVLVDGKPFFGEDPSLALRNMPAEVIDKVQIFDKMSEQAEFTGFDDGQSSKTMNLITKNFKRSGTFGKFSGGYGHQDKYIGTLNLNIFDNDRRISIMGISNNISQQNFSFMDILDMFGGGGGQRGQFFRIASRVMGPGGFRPPGGENRMLSQSGMGDFMVGQMDGISSTHAFGVNYSDMWGENIEVTGSYFFNYTANSNEQVLNREYILSSDSLSFYNQNTDSYNKSNNHRFNFRFKYDIDSNNSILLKPNLTVQASNIDNNQLSEYLLSNANPVNESDNFYQSTYDGMNFSNELLFKHRFETKGRTFSISLNTSLNDKKGAAGQFTESIYYKPNQTSDTLNQKSQSPTNGYGLSGNISYTEPIADNQQLLFSYNANYNSNNSDKRTYDFNPFNLDYDVLDTLLSNKFDNFYFTQKGELNYRFKNDEINFTAGISYQRAELNSLQDFPHSLTMNYKFDNMLPSLRFQYKFSKQDNLNIYYRTSTYSPSISQLQNVIDVSNPMQLSIGNPLLGQQYSHFLMGRFSSFSTDFNNVILLFSSLNYKTNTIGNSTFIAPKDTILEGGIILPAGGQLTIPFNLGGSYSISSFFTYGFPVNFIKSKMNLNLGGMYSRTLSLVNNVTNFSDAYNTNLQIVLTSNISEDVDFTIASRGNFAITKNTIREDLDNNYNYYTNSLYLNWIFWEGFFLNVDLRNQFYTGLVQENNNNFTLLNISIGKKLFPNNAGEIKLTLFDALKQNKSIQTNVTDYYIEYAQNKILQQYIMLTFTYNLRAFSGMMPQIPFGPPGHRHE